MTPKLTEISQNAFVADLLEVARQVAADSWRADFLVGIGRGGLVPATYLSHATGLPMLSIDYSSGQPDFAEALLAKLAGRTIEGQRLIFVDDINDGGRTIGLLRRALFDAGAALANVRFAALITNVSSAERVDYAAREIDRRSFTNWFVFPWEAVAPKAAVVEEASTLPDRLRGTDV